MDSNIQESSGCFNIQVKLEIRIVSASFISNVKCNRCTNYNRRLEHDDNMHKASKKKPTLVSLSYVIRLNAFASLPEEMQHVRLCPLQRTLWPKARAPNSLPHHHHHHLHFKSCTRKIQNKRKELTLARK